MSRIAKIPPAQIVVRDRHRTDMGDVQKLADSILAVGLLHPLVLDERHRLIAGERRLAAWQLLHGPNEPVPSHIVKTVDSARLLLIAERDENTCRKEMSPSEYVALGAALEAIEKPKAEERMKAGTPPQVAGGSAGEVNKIVAPAVGVSPRTYEKAKAVVAAAEDESLTPEVREVAREAVAEMDRSGKVDGAFKKVEAARNEAFDRKVGELTGGSPEVAKANWNAHASKVAAAIASFVNADPDHFASHADAAHVESVESEVVRIVSFMERVRASRRQLKAVQ